MHDVPELDKDMCHMIAGGMFEVLRHDMPKDWAKRFIAQLQGFYTAGCAKKFVKANFFEDIRDVRSKNYLTAISALLFLCFVCLTGSTSERIHVEQKTCS